jgi:hypothetical protein
MHNSGLQTRERERDQSEKKEIEIKERTTHSDIEKTVKFDLFIT